MAEIGEDLVFPVGQRRQQWLKCRPAFLGLLLRAIPDASAGVGLVVPAVDVRELFLGLVGSLDVRELVAPGLDDDGFRCLSADEDARLEEANLGRGGPESPSCGEPCSGIAARLPCPRMVNIWASGCLRPLGRSLMANLSEGIGMVILMVPASQEKGNSARTRHGKRQAERHAASLFNFIET